MIALLDTEVGRGYIMHVPHALADPEGNLLQQMWQGVDKKIYICFPHQTRIRGLMRKSSNNPHHTLRVKCC
jgi:hypothetical protein